MSLQGVQRIRGDSVCSSYTDLCQVPQSKVSVSHEGFRLLGQRIKALGIPCVVVQEGGYDIATLDENASRFFAGMTA